MQIRNFVQWHVNVVMGNCCILSAYAYLSDIFSSAHTRTYIHTWQCVRVCFWLKKNMWKFNFNTNRWNVQRDRRWLDECESLLQTFSFWLEQTFWRINFSAQPSTACRSICGLVGWLVKEIQWLVELTKGSSIFSSQHHTCLRLTVSTAAFGEWNGLEWNGMYEYCIAHTTNDVD